MKKKSSVSAFFAGRIVGIVGLVNGVMGHAGKRPKTLGLQTNGLFEPCPDKPNCVSTQAKDVKHGISPYRLTQPIPQAKEKIKAAIAQMPGSTLIRETENYLYYEFKSALIGFVDDVELYFNEGDSTIQFRSASRLGYSDLGVNRKRMETLRKLIGDTYPN